MVLISIVIAWWTHGRMARKTMLRTHRLLAHSHKFL